MSNFVASLLMVLLLFAVVALLQHNHHRTAGSPRIPLGSEPDPELKRIWLNLTAGRH